MVTKEALNSAINNHSIWKRRLISAIETGKSEFQTAIVQKDNVCEFGKWLESLPSIEKGTEDFQKVKDLHSKFHKSAASTLGLALTGKRDAAMEELNFSGTFGEISSKLSVALGNWKKKL
ncbi:MAG: CZB domain-containing protein [Ignavibacteriae bacterium]|nr:CZB domain-containing protein [Ignavibacteriota bacterium]